MSPHRNLRARCAARAVVVRCTRQPGTALANASLCAGEVPNVRTMSENGVGCARPLGSRKRMRLRSRPGGILRTVRGPPSGG